MKTVYQVESRLKGGEWLEDHLPFDSKEEAIEYIKSQPKCFEYRITCWEEPEEADFEAANWASFENDRPFWEQ